MQGKELKAARKAMNLRQAGLAEALGLSAPFIGMMERGEKPIEPRTALAVKYLLDNPDERPAVEIGDIKSRSVADLMQIDFSLKDGREWGRWRFSADSMTLDFDSEETLVDRDADGNDVFERRERYYVTLIDMTDAKRVLDWVGQIAGKKWGPTNTGHFVEALEDIFNLQATFVHGPGYLNGEDVLEAIRSRMGQNEDA